MSEYMSAEIWLGGRISKRLVPGLCQAITEQSVATDWGDGQFRPRTASDLSAACSEDGADGRLLHFCDDQARWGAFELLEAFLRRRKIGYTRRSEGKWEYEPERIEYRPPGQPVALTVNNSGEVVMPVTKLVALSAALSKLAERLTAGTLAKPAGSFTAIARRLRNALPVEAPPLAPFEIVDIPSRSCPHGR